MKIGLFYDHLGRSRGGVEAWIYHVAYILQESVHQVCVYTLDNDEPNVDDVPEKVEVRRISNKTYPMPGKVIWTVKKVSHQMKIIADDIDAFWTRSYTMTAAAAKISLGRPVIYIQATPFPEYLNFAISSRKNEVSFIRLLYWRIMQREIYYVEKLAMKQSDALVYLSTTRMNETMAYYNVNYHPKCYVIPSGVDLNKFTPPMRKDLHYNINIISVCRLSVEKNIPCVLKAVRILVDRGLRISYKIVGDGPELHSLVKLISELKLENHVELMGRQSCVEKYLRQADIFVLPSTYEGFGTVYLEAMACGLPCIALKGNPPHILVASEEVIEHEQTGWVLEHNSPEILADTLETAYLSPELVQSFSKRARSVCETKYSWDMAVKKLCEVTLSLRQ